MAGNDKIKIGTPEFEQFKEALHYINETLAKKMAGDGEGATALFEAKIIGAKTKEQAKTLAKSIVCSNLTKAAIAGHDANWGRILCAMGRLGPLIRKARTFEKVTRSCARNVQTANRVSPRNPYSVNWFYWYTREASCAIYVTNIPACWFLLRRLFSLDAFGSSGGKSRDPRGRQGYGNASNLQSGTGDSRSVKGAVWSVHGKPSVRKDRSQSEENINPENKDIPLEIWQQVSFVVYGLE